MDGWVKPVVESFQNNRSIGLRKFGEVGKEFGFG